MNCDQAKDMLADAVGNELAGVDQAAFEDHLRSCDACRMDFASLTKTLSALRRLKTVPPQASLPIGTQVRDATPRRFRLFTESARYAAAVALAFVAGFLARGGVKSDSGHDRPRQPATPVVDPHGGADLTTREALASAFRRNPRANELANLMIALHTGEKP